MKRRPRELSLQQCYEALGLEQGADLEALKSAYRRRAFELHPDLHPENPQAGSKFQVVNEAYVILTKVLSPGQQGATAEEKAPAGGATEEKPPDDAADAGAKQQEQAREAGTGTQGPRPEGGDKAHGRHEEAQDGTDAEQRTRRAAQAAYAREEDVLRDLLNDPFARRVFEDIYAQVQDAQAPPPPPPQADAGEKGVSPANAQAEWGRQLNLDFSRGIGKAVKGWMRRQIDEEQTFHLPPAMLRPGARIRLQIRRGISDEISTVEITLPQEYTTGKPVRLKGMGKRIGRWQGDLYLTLVAKQSP
ncbi:MAG: DnaJ domain-containing protein [Deltaproteobacteria bacterium]|jgi:molecular chaperone DnaJ|nr:DnaJ domain-containing protein [Deltaproteobacteria bacterium]